MLAYGSNSRHSVMLQRLQILSSKSTSLNGLMGFGGNQLGLLLKRRRERFEFEDKVVTEEVQEVKKVKKKDEIVTVMILEFQESQIGTMHILAHAANSA